MRITKPEVELPRRDRHCEKSMWRHNSAVDGPIWIKFGRLMQTVIVMVTDNNAKMKIETGNRIPARRTGRLFQETGSSNISTVDWEMLSKFGMQVDFNLPNWAKSQKTKSEVELPRRGRHLLGLYELAEIS